MGAVRDGVTVEGAVFVVIVVGTVVKDSCDAGGRHRPRPGLHLVVIVVVVGVEVIVVVVVMPLVVGGSGRLHGLVVPREKSLKNDDDKH